MTPQEKAIDLFVKYYERLPDDTYSNESAKSEAKQYTLIAVDELIEHTDWTEANYWKEVKQEIEKL